jgi:5'/3'-nucleotidase
LTKKRILISNDDGVHSPGIRALAEALADLGEVFVVAPESEQSGAGHSLTLSSPLRIKQYDDHRFSVDGTPTDAIYLASEGLFLDQRFDLCASGINAGGNMGQDITYSGTVAAAMESTLHGIPSFAISLDGRNGYCWDTAAKYAQKVASYILNNGLPKGVLLNVNIPNLPIEQVKSHRMTRMGKRVYGGEPVIEKTDPRGAKYFWIGGQDLGFEPIDGTDLLAVSRGRVSITPVHLDMTEYKQLVELSGIEL